MNNTTKISIVAGADLQQLLIAELSSIDFDAFEEKENKLESFIKEKNFDEGALRQVLEAYKVDYSKEVVKEENWNALWESNFLAVVVDDFCVIRAAFHQPIPGIKYEIIITPKMSFGTGHHATTYMMVSQMSGLDFTNATVADFGTGTGILAILAEKLGAKSVWAIDNDDWSIENATENIEKNFCKIIKIQKADHFASGEKFDVILANINRNVILDNISDIHAAMQKGSVLLLSGLLESDEVDVVNIFRQHKIFPIKSLHRSKWLK